MKTIAGAAFRSWFSVVGAKNEFIMTVYIICISTPVSGMMIQTKRCVLNYSRRVGKSTVLVY
jgi:hypothetical protein